MTSLVMSLIMSLVLTCTYCGELADTADHVPSRVVRAMLLSVAAPVELPVFLVVPSCRSCNCSLGVDGQTVLERKQIIHERLRERWRSVCPEWTTEEIAAPGKNMRSYMEGAMAEREELERRLLFSFEPALYAETSSSPYSNGTSTADQLAEQKPIGKSASRAVCRRCSKPAASGYCSTECKKMLVIETEIRFLSRQRRESELERVRAMKRINMKKNYAKRRRKP